MSTTYYSPSNAAVSESYDVEFNDSIIDTRYWKSRSEGTQITSTKINLYKEGDNA